MRSLYLIIFGAIALLVSCQNNKVYSPQDQITQVEMNISGLQDLGDSCWYEGWLMWGESNEVIESVGVFKVDGQGNLTPSSLKVNLGQMQQAQAFLLTIEEDDVPGYIVTTTTTPDTVIYDSVAGPSVYQLMSGLLRANTAEMALGHPNFNEYDFSLSTGSYLLNTPTDINNTNPKSGVWFVDKDSLGLPVQGLGTTAISGRWNYEGWVVIDGTPVSTGRFRNPAIADDGNPYSETSGTAYRFPGEDFLRNAPSGVTFPADLSGHSVYITLIAPRPAKANSPFAEMKLLEATVPSNAVSGTVYEMTNGSAKLPSGTVTLNIQIYE